MAKTPSMSSEAEPATNEPDPRIPTNNKDEGDESSDGDDDEGNESGDGDDESGESSDDEEEEKPESDSKKLNPSTSTPIPSKAPAEWDDSESESESEPEPEPDNKKLDLSTSTPVPSKVPAESDESESESESESDSEAAKLVTPISSKPMPEIGSPVSKPPVAEIAPHGCHLRLHLGRGRLMVAEGISTAINLWRSEVISAGGRRGSGQREIDGGGGAKEGCQDGRGEGGTSKGRREKGFLENEWFHLSREWLWEERECGPHLLLYS